MAQKVEILITAKNAVASGIKGAQKALKGFGASAAGMARGVAGVVAAVGASVIALGSKLIALHEKQVRAEMALANAHRLNGENAEYMVKGETKAAAAIASATGKTKADTVALMARLRMLGVASASLEKATRATYALEAAGMSQAAASRAVMQAMSGNYTMLQRLSPAIRNAKTETEKLAAFNKICEVGYANLEAQMATFTGQTVRVKNAFAGLMAEVGRSLNRGNWAGSLMGRLADSVEIGKNQLSDILEAKEDTAQKRIADLNAEIERLDNTLYKGIDASEAFWAEWRKAGAGEKVAMLGKRMSQTEGANVMRDASDKYRLEIEKRLISAVKERDRLIKEQSENERREAQALLDQKTEEAKRLNRIRELYERVRMAKKQYYDVHEQEKAIAAMQKELDLARRRFDMEQRAAAKERDAFEAQRDNLQAVLDGNRRILETDFAKFRENARAEAEAEKAARKNGTRNERALKEGERIDGLLKRGMAEKNLTKSQREKWEFWKQTEAAKNALANAAGGMGSAKELIAATEQAIKDAADNIANRQPVSFQDSEEYERLSGFLQEAKDSLAEMPSKEDLKGEIEALTKALETTKAESSEWQERQMELEKEQAENSATMAEILGKVEGLIRGQSEWLQKNLEGI